MSMASYDRLTISGKAEFDSIISFSMRQTAGKHAEANLRGVLTEKGAQMLAGKLSEEIITILDKETGKFPPIFEGVIDKVGFSTENGLDVAEITLLAGSFLLDLEQKSKSYQDVGLTYEEIISDVLREIPLGNSVIADEIRDKRIGRPIIRYRESAWEFIRRLASHYNLPVFSDVRSGEPRVYVGVPSIHRYEAVFAENAYTVGGGSEYYAAGGPLLGLDKSDFLRYDIEDGNPCFLGWRAKFKNRSFYICGKTCRMDKGLLVYGYTLADRKFWYTPRQYNRFFCGMSLLGRVLRSERDDVRLRLDIDETQNVETAYPWPWVPETGNLMYLMPRVGSRVSLYFGDDDEANGQAINCIRDNAPTPPTIGSATMPATATVVAPPSADAEQLASQPNEGDQDVGPAYKEIISDVLSKLPGENSVTTDEIQDDEIAEMEGFLDRYNYSAKYRALTTEHNKSICLYPGSIGLGSYKMTAYGENNRYTTLSPSQTLWITDRRGVRFSSDAEFKIIAGKNVLIEGKTVSIKSKGYAYLARGSFDLETDAEFTARIWPAIYLGL